VVRGALSPGISGGVELRRLELSQRIKKKYFLPKFGGIYSTSRTYS
jgi:hypothetical protein